jgi:hypothetical protein
VKPLTNLTDHFGSPEKLKTEIKMCIEKEGILKIITFGFKASASLLYCSGLLKS